MRKLLILFFATSLFVACNNNKDDRRSTRDRDRERDDYRSKDDEKGDDRRNTDYKDDQKNPEDRDSRETDDNNRSRDDDRKSNDGITTSDGWPSSERVAFVKECVPAAEKKGLTYSQASDYCECMQKKIERAYPDINEAAKIDMSSPRLQQMVEDCAPRQ